MGGADVTNQTIPAPMIEMNAVRFDYEAMAMRFDLTVAAGEMVAVIGPSGAGKSTLLNLIAGFEAGLSGTIYLVGTDQTHTAPAHRPVTTLFQEMNLFPHLSVARNVGLGIDPRLRLSRDDRARVSTALARVGLDGKQDRLPGQLSGGERQRAALARSLVRDRPILLLDEPFAALDPPLRRQMVALVERLRGEQGLTVLLVTHQLDELSGTDPRTLFVDDGRIIADQPLSTYTAHHPIKAVAAFFPATAPDAVIANGPSGQ